MRVDQSLDRDACLARACREGQKAASAALAADQFPDLGDDDALVVVEVADVGRALHLLLRVGRARLESRVLGSEAEIADERDGRAASRPTLRRLSPRSSRISLCSCSARGPWTMSARSAIAWSSSSPSAACDGVERGSRDACAQFLDSDGQQQACRVVGCRRISARSRRTRLASRLRRIASMSESPSPIESFWSSRRSRRLSSSSLEVVDGRSVDDELRFSPTFRSR